MKYLIAKKVIYDTDTGEIEAPGSEEIEGKKLTNIPNRILTLLIMSQGKVLERDYLLEHVWESAGHASSSSSLNQYISILRKTLTSLIDVKDTILVVPRVGFYLTEDIPIEEYRPPDITPEPDGVASQPRDACKSRQRGITIAGMGIITLLVVLNIWTAVGFPKYERYDDLYYIGKLDKCSLNSFDKMPEILYSKLTHIVTELEPSLKALCSQHPALVMLYAQRAILYGGAGRVYASYCPEDPQTKKILHCNNSYIFNWGRQ